MTTSAGQPAVYRLGSSRYVQAVVTKVVSGDTVELVAFSDGSAWGDGDPASLGAKVYDSIALGTGVGEWQPGTLVDAAIAAATTNLATYSYVDSGVAGRCAVPGAGSAVGSPAFATPRRPSTTRPTRVTVYGSFAMASTLLGPQSGTATLLADSSATPSTQVGVAPAALSGVAANATVPWTMTYDVPANHWYQVTVSVSANTTANLLHINEQVQ